MTTSFASYGIIVLIFNLYWLINYGWSGYKEFYNGSLSKYFTIFVWLYTISGLISLIYSFFR